MARSAGFWNVIAGRYSRQPVADEAAYRHKLEVTRSYLRPEMEVLEFGCGTGSTAIAHAPHVASILGLDYARKMIEIARGRAKAAGVENAHFEVADFDDWDAGGTRFDMVMGHSILHLVRDRAAAVRKVRGLLKPGGLFVSSTACIDHIPAAGKVLLGIGSYVRILPQIGVFSEDELVATMTQEGFAIEHRWRPAPEKAVFIVARRVDQ